MTTTTLLLLRLFYEVKTPIHPQANTRNTIDLCGVCSFTEKVRFLYRLQKNSNFGTSLACDWIQDSNKQLCCYYDQLVVLVSFTKHNDNYKFAAAATAVLWSKDTNTPTRQWCLLIYRKGSIPLIKVLLCVFELFNRTQPFKGKQGDTKHKKFLFTSVALILIRLKIVSFELILGNICFY